MVAVFTAVNCGAEGTWPEAANASFDLSLFNAFLRGGGLHIAERRCSSCSDAGYRSIFYKRFTNPETVDYSQLLLGVWASADNVLGTDFGLYSTLSDALTGSNIWTACNYDDFANIGSFRDCGDRVD